MKKTILPFTGLCLTLCLLIFSCKNEPSGPWDAFVKCATNACVAEVVAVKDAFLKDPKPIFEKFVETDQKGEDHFIGWLYILRDSVLLNSSYSPTEDRLAMQQALIDTSRAYENDPKYGSFAKSIISEVEMLAIASELEDVLYDFAPVTGTYSFELPNDGGSGELKVNRTDAENIRFELSVVAGPPAHNQGMMEGTAKLTEMNVFEYATTEFGGTCKLQFTFGGEAVEIKTLEGDPAACGFGNGVVADNVYRMSSYDDPFLSGADAKTAQNLLGTWVSTEDEKSVLKIENGMYIEVYDGEEMGRTPFQFFPKCPPFCNPEGGFACLAVMGQDDVCYAVVKADGMNLEFSMVGGTGNTLVYKKK
jgi:hypothetical protein